MKPLPPTLREKRRYIIFQIKSSKKFTKKQVEKAVTKIVLDSIGLFGAVDSSYWLVKFDEKKQVGILRTTNKFLELIFASFGFLTEINGSEVAINLLKTTGTIKKAEKQVKQMFYNQ